MLPYENQHVIEALQDAPNINAALKNFLKREVTKGAPSEKFVKKLKGLVGSNSNAALKDFIEKHGEEYAPILLGITRYAYTDAMDSIATEIIEKYADDFNATYEVQGESIEVKDRENFDRIVKAVSEIISKKLQEAEIPASPFVKNVVWDWILEAPVAKEVFPMLAKS